MPWAFSLCYVLMLTVHIYYKRFCRNNLYWGIPTHFKVGEVNFLKFCFCSELVKIHPFLGIKCNSSHSCLLLGSFLLSVLVALDCGFFLLFLSLFGWGFLNVYVLYRIINALNGLPGFTAEAEPPDIVDIQALYWGATSYERVHPKLLSQNE